MMCFADVKHLAYALSQALRQLEGSGGGEAKQAKTKKSDINLGIDIENWRRVS